MWSSVQAVSQTPTRWEDLAPEPLSLTLHLLLTWENNTSEPPRLVEMFQGSFRCSIFNASFKKYILNYSESQLFWSKNSRRSQTPFLLRCEREHGAITTRASPGSLKTVPRTQGEQLQRTVTICTYLCTPSGVFLDVTH